MIDLQLGKLFVTSANNPMMWQSPTSDLLEIGESDLAWVGFVAGKHFDCHQIDRRGIEQESNLDAGMNAD